MPAFAQSGDFVVHDEVLAGRESGSVAVVDDQDPHRVTVLDRAPRLGR